MNKEQWIKIIEHQINIRLNEKGLNMGNSLSLKELYQMKYEVALELLCELGA